MPRRCGVGYFLGDNGMTFQKNIRRLRGNESQDTVARRGGFHSSWLSALERGRVGTSLVGLARVAKGLNVYVCDLFIDEEGDPIDRRL